MNILDVHRKNMLEVYKKKILNLFDEARRHGVEVKSYSKQTNEELVEQ